MKRKIYWLDVFGTRHFETTVDESKFRETLDHISDKAKAAHLYGYAKSEIL
jgi:hypothetical protein